MRRTQTSKPRRSAAALDRRSRDPAGSSSEGPARQNVVIVSDRPIYARAIQAWLNTGRPEVRSRILFGTDLARLFPSENPDLVLLMPQDWAELAHWLPGLRRRFACRPWLLLADWRLVGMFLSFLSNQPCAVVEPGGPDQELGRFMESLVDCPFSSPTHELLARFARGSSLPPTRLPARLPTAMELQCGCAVSFGLRDAQIAQHLQVSEATVKSHLHHFLGKLGLRNRVELGECVQRAFAPRSLPGDAEVSSSTVDPDSQRAFGREGERITVRETLGDRAGCSSPHDGSEGRPRLVRKEASPSLRGVPGAGATVSGERHGW